MGCRLTMPMIGRGLSADIRAKYGAVRGTIRRRRLVTLGKRRGGRRASELASLPAAPPASVGRCLVEIRRCTFQYFAAKRCRILRGGITHIASDARSLLGSASTARLPGPTRPVRGLPLTQTRQSTSEASH
jgi:hypothetical protein